MARDLYLGSPEGGMIEFAPRQKKRASFGVLAYNRVEVAVMGVFGSVNRSPLFIDKPTGIFGDVNKWSFYIDPENRRLYLPSAGFDSLSTNDRGGSIYSVAGDFQPTPNIHFGEFGATRARVLTEKVVESAIESLRRCNFSFYADDRLYKKIGDQWCSNRSFPKDLPLKVSPVKF